MAGEWIPQDGDQINLKFKTTWIAQDGDLVELVFGEPPPPPKDCEWVDVPGDQVVLVVPEKTWVDVPGDQVVIQLPNCGGGGGGTLDLEPEDFYHGETLTGRLDESYQVEFHYGTSFEVDLTTTPVARFEAEIHHGEAFEPLLGVDWRFVATAHHGEAATFDLTTRPAVVLAPRPFYYGESLRETSFRPEYVGLGSSFYYGESLIGGLTERAPITLSGVGYYGESLVLDNLNTSIQFPGTFYHGEALTSSLEFPGLYTELAATIRYGEALSLGVLNLGAITLNGFVYHGEALSATLTTKPSEPFGFVLFYHGENAWFTMQTSEALPLLPFRHGEVFTVAELDEVPPNTAYYGESLTAYLSTEDIFRPRPFYYGENQNYGELILPPRADLAGTFSDGYGGTTAPGENELTVMYHARMSVVLRESMYVNGALNGYFSNHNQTDFSDSGWNLDLEVPSPGVFNLELGNGDRQTDRYTKEAIALTADLSTLSRFRGEFYHGESAYTVDLDIYLDDHGIIEMCDGLSLSSKPLYANQYIPLCYGNFIPDPDNLYIDFAGIEVLECPAHSAFVGETLTGALESNSGVGAAHYYGETFTVTELIGGSTVFEIEFKGSQNLAADLTHDSTWMFLRNVYHGENLRADLTVSQKYSNFEGLIEFRYGEAFAQNTSLITDVRRRTVRHLESGCLSNEYVPMTESGDLDWSQFNPVPVELDPFTHEIKAICE